MWVGLSACANHEIVDVDISSGLVTTSVDSFVAGLRTVDNNNEIVLSVRSVGEPPIGLEDLRRNTGPGEVSLLPLASDTAAITRPAGQGFANFTDVDMEAVAKVLREHGVADIWQASASPVMSATLSNDLDELLKVVEALATHPNLDRIEANIVAVVRPDG